MISKVKKLDIPINRPLYTSYMEALAAQGEFDKATAAIDMMQAEIGSRPTGTT